MEQTTQKSFKPGNLFYTSWGYDQTNYEYIVILSISKSGKTATCKRTSYISENKGYYNEQKPIFSPFGESFKMRVGTKWDPSVLRGSYPFSHTGTGSKRLDTFSKVDENRKYHETALGYGH